ncbi:hypothetical protein NPIL_402711 [Nephila pilipes]|uniref:Uncharacterized protein n=1 Tax=Nephila pilipes TaxID=299642 RepID=A0A8X6QHG1_NEPPI|nr:hypothetical protein NPIL_402711 [Nephila pilipes]
MNRFLLSSPTPSYLPRTKENRKKEKKKAPLLSYISASYTHRPVLQPGRTYTAENVVYVFCCTTDRILRYGKLVRRPPRRKRRTSRDSVVQRSRPKPRTRQFPIPSIGFLLGYCSQHGIFISSCVHSA